MLDYAIPATCVEFGIYGENLLYRSRPASIEAGRLQPGHLVERPSLATFRRKKHAFEKSSQ
jgi:hypothetical protein